MMNANFNAYLENKLLSEFYDRIPITFKNKWMNFMEIDYSYYLACAGIEARQQWTRLDKYRFVAGVALQKIKPLSIDTYCTDQWMSMQYIHPVFFSNNTNQTDYIGRQLAIFGNED